MRKLPFTASAVPILFIGSAKFLIDTGRALSELDAPTVVRVPLATRNVLRQCVGNYFAMQRLRALLMQLHCADRVHAQSDVAVVELVSTLVHTGRLHLVSLAPAPTTVRRFLTLQAAPPPPPAPRAAPRQQQRNEEASEPSFNPALDAALLAAMLVAASSDGTAFCEECERADRSA